MPTKWYGHKSNWFVGPYNYNSESTNFKNQEKCLLSLMLTKITDFLVR